MQFHANNEQLLNYRDEHLLEATVKQHIDGCNECLQLIAELKDLSCLLNEALVNDLSEVELDESWGGISSSLDAVEKPKTNNRVWLGLAASVVFAVVFGTQMLQSKKSLEQSVKVSTKSPVLIASTQKTPDIDQLVAYSRLIENRLQAMPQPRVVRANTVGTITNLQDHISMLDTRLSMQHQAPLTEPQRNALWQQRVNSMNSLYRVRAAQLQRVSY